jgi:hypothetical protein
MGGVFAKHLKSEYCLDSVVPGGGKCPEEEHTTCSGGPTINCHKRGLRGERIISNKMLEIIKERIKC